MGIHAKKTTIGIADTGVGPFTLVAGLVGEIVLPEVEYPVEKFWANDDTEPTGLVGDPNIGDVEYVVAYEDQDRYDALEAYEGEQCYIEYTFVNGDKRVYKVVLSKRGPVTGAENMACVGKLGFSVLSLTSKTPAA